MTSLQHERIDELCRELRLSATPDLYGAIAQSAAKKKDTTYADFLEAQGRARGAASSGTRHADQGRRLPVHQDAGSLRLRLRHRRATGPDPGAGIARF